MKITKRITIWSVIIISVSVVVLIFLPGFFGFKISHTKEDKAYRQLEYISEIIDLYNEQRGDFPTEEKGLIALIESKGNGPYFQNSDFLLDPWRNRIVYKRIITPRGSSYLMYSIGRNGIDEGGGGDDIVYREKGPRGRS